MEEQQIRDIVHRVSTDETLRQELARDPQSFIEREGVSSTVAKIVMKLVPHLTLANNDTGEQGWWA